MQRTVKPKVRDVSMQDIGPCWSAPTLPQQQQLKQQQQPSTTMNADLLLQNNSEFRQ